MTYATTFSGIGGWELGLNACGWVLQWQCECEPFCQALLRERFGVLIYGDIRTLAEANPPKVDALIGSPPCQPFSVAGSRRSTADERHLYPSFIRCVGLLKPRWVLMEQVAGILSDNGGDTFGRYAGGLAALGYDLVWHCIPVCAVGANHERDRVWIIAHDNRLRKSQQKGQFSEIGRRLDHEAKNASDDHEGLGFQPNEEIRAGWNSSNAGRQDVADALRWSSSQGNSGQSEGQKLSRKASPNLNSARFQERFVQRGIQGKKRCNPFWQDTSLDPAWAFEPPLVRRLHGIPDRVDAIRSLGNAVYPKIPEIIGQAINEVEKEETA